MTADKLISEAMRALANRRWKKTPKGKARSHPYQGGAPPRKYTRCKRYGSHRFSPATGRCPCGYARPK